jgi:hypothetical protein
VACVQRRFDFGRRQEVDLAGVGGDQECFGSRSFDIVELLRNIVRDA